MSLTYEADFDQDGTYTNISAYVQAASWTVGMQRPFDNVGWLNTATLTLINTGGEWNGEDTTNRISAYLNTPFPVRIKNGSTVLWWGRAKGITHTYEPSGTQTAKTVVTLQAVGDRDYADAVEAEINLLQNVTADQVFVDLVRQIPDKPIAGRFIIGVSTIGGSDTIAADSDHYSGETGDTTLGRYPIADAGMALPASLRNPDANDIFRANNSITSHMENIANAEGGWVFEGRDKWHFWKSTHNFGSSAGTVGDTGTYKPKQVTYEHAPNRSNYIIAYTVDEVDETEVTLWQLRTTISIPSLGTTKITVPLKADELPTSATNLRIVDVEGTGVSAWGVTPRGDHAELSFTTNLFAGGTVTAARVIGERIRAADELIIIRKELNSAANDRFTQPTRLNLRSLDDYDRAVTIAELELTRRKPLKYAVTDFLLSDAVGNLPLWDVGTRITIDLPSLNHDRDYVVVGEQHSSRGLGYLHNTKYIVRPWDQSSETEATTLVWDATGHKWDGTKVWG